MTRADKIKALNEDCKPDVDKLLKKNFKKKVKETDLIKQRENERKEKLRKRQSILLNEELEEDEEPEEPEEIEELEEDEEPEEPDEPEETV